MRSATDKYSICTDLYMCADYPTDGVLLLRSLLGFSGAAVTNSALAPDATRTSWPEIRNHLQSRCAMSPLAP